MEPNDHITAITMKDIRKNIVFLVKSKPLLNNQKPVSSKTAKLSMNRITLYKLLLKNETFAII